MHTTETMISSPTQNYKEFSPIIHNHHFTNTLIESMTGLPETYATKNYDTILRQTIKQTKTNSLNYNCFTNCSFVLDQSHYHHQAKEDSLYKLPSETPPEAYES